VRGAGLSGSWEEKGAGRGGIVCTCASNFNGTLSNRPQ
jgi:hypothetical protein